MRVIKFEKFGAADEVLQLTEETDFTPGPEEVLVKIETSGVNPSDVKKRAGSSKNLLNDGFVIPHSDGAGVIVAVGDNVSQERVGQRVWIYQAQYGRRFGTASDVLAIDSCRAPELPDAASFEVGACLGIPAMTSHRCVFSDGDVSGQTILVSGGAGRVGHYAIQWAKLGGASVIASSSNPADVQACKEAGADAVVNHRDSDYADQIMAASEGKKIDRFVEVEFGKNLEAVLKVARTGATITTYSSMQDPQPTIPFYQMMFKDITVRFVIVYAMPESAKEQAIDDINEALRDGKLIHRVTHTLPLTECARAHEIIEDETTRGCVVVATNPSDG
jgi:NADPH2:quinone reductase